MPEYFPKQVLSVAKVARIEDKSEYMIRRDIARGIIPAVKFMGRTGIPADYKRQTGNQSKKQD